MQRLNLFQDNYNVKDHVIIIKIKNILIIIN